MRLFQISIFEDTEDESVSQFIDSEEKLFKEIDRIERIFKEETGVDMPDEVMNIKTYDIPDIFMEYLYQESEAYVN